MSNKLTSTGCAVNHMLTVVLSMVFGVLLAMSSLVFPLNQVFFIHSSDSHFMDYLHMKLFLLHFQLTQFSYNVQQSVALK